MFFLYGMSYFIHTHEYKFGLNFFCWLLVVRIVGFVEGKKIERRRCVSAVECTVGYQCFGAVDRIFTAHFNFRLQVFFFCL